MWEVLLEAARLSVAYWITLSALIALSGLLFIFAGLRWGAYEEGGR
jgi:hypothetical protein